MSSSPLTGTGGQFQWCSMFLIILTCPISVYVFIPPVLKTYMTKPRESSCFKLYWGTPWHFRREIDLECSLQHIGVPGDFSQACVQFNDSCKTWAHWLRWEGDCNREKGCSRNFLHCFNNKVFLFSELSTTRTTHSKQSIKDKTSIYLLPGWMYSAASSWFLLL